MKKYLALLYVVCVLAASAAVYSASYGKSISKMIVALADGPT